MIGRTFSARRRLCAAFIVIAAAGCIHAAPILPSGLNPGDQYRLAFVTSGTRDAASAEIADYNAFVTSQANSNIVLQSLAATWFAIGSTRTVTASENIGGVFNMPIYNLSGLRIANGSADLWDGSLENPVSYDQDGALRPVGVYTGTNWYGSSDIDYLGQFTLVSKGSSQYKDTKWMYVDFVNKLELHSFYGISAPLTVPGGDVPEPGTMGLLTLGLMGLGWRHFGRLRRTRFCPRRTDC